MKITADVRGNVCALLKLMVERHKKKYEDIEIIGVSQSEDVIVWDDYENKKAGILFEVKLERDLVDSLNSKRLEQEFTNTYLQSMIRYNANDIYLICGGIYDPIIYSRLVGFMNGKFPMIRFHVPTSTETAIEKILDIARNPPILPNYSIPVLERTKDKNFILSISALQNGISERTATALAKIIHKDVTITEIENCINDEFPREYTVLAGKIYDTLNATYLREKSDINE